jgi:putative flippase GtrA
VKNLLSRQFMVFLLTGGIAALFNIFSRILYNQWTSYSTAVILAYLTGFITAYILMKLFVFKKSRHSTTKSVFYFTLVNGFALLQTWAISMGLLYYLLPLLNITWHAAEVAHFIGVIAPVFTSYLGHKYFSFG